jgi:hypothetical protein
LAREAVAWLLLLGLPPLFETVADLLPLALVAVLPAVIVAPSAN